MGYDDIGEKINSGYYMNAGVSAFWDDLADLFDMADHPKRKAVEAVVSNHGSGDYHAMFDLYADIVLIVRS